MEIKDFKNDWEKAKQYLVKFSKEAQKIAVKSEKEVVKFSKKGMLQLDSTTIGIKREKIYYQIGKAYAGLEDFSKPSARLLKLMNDLGALNKKQAGIKKKLATEKKAEKAAKKGTAKTAAKKAAPKADIKKSE